MITILFLSVIFVSCLIQGITGFGFALIAAPLGLLFYGQNNLVVVLTIVSLALNSYLIFKIEADFDKQLAKHLLLSGLVGVPIGVVILTAIPSDVLKIAAAVAASVFGFILFRKQLINSTIPSKSSSGRNHPLTLGVGFLTGFLQSSVGLSGPPLVLLLTNYGVQPKVMRKTLALLFLSFSTFSLPIFLIKNAIALSDVYTALMAVPLVIAGGFLGNKIADSVSVKLFRVVTVALVFVSSGQVILKVLKIT